MISSMQTKVRIARQFSQAAHCYDQLAEVQWQIGVDAVSQVTPTSGMLLDIGSGTGRISALLADKSGQVIGLDLAEGMARFASRTQPNKVGFLVGDADNLPFADNVFDYVFSCMALQWCQPISQAFSEVARVMKPGAKGLLAMMVQGSLQELHRCWQAVGQPAHVNHFLSLETLEQAAKQVGLTWQVQTRLYQTWHTSLRDALHSIKDIGAGVVLNPTRSPLSKAVIQAVERRYFENYQQQGLVPVSYQVAFMEIQK